MLCNGYDFSFKCSFAQHQCMYSQQLASQTAPNTQRSLLAESHSSYFTNYCCPTPHLMCSVSPLSSFIYLPQPLSAFPLILVFHTHHTLMPVRIATGPSSFSSPVFQIGGSKQKTNLIAQRPETQVKAGLISFLLSCLPLYTLQQWQQHLKCAHMHTHTHNSDLIAASQKEQWKR